MDTQPTPRDLVWLQSNVEGFYRQRLDISPRGGLVAWHDLRILLGTVPYVIAGQGPVAVLSSASRRSSRRRSASSWTSASARR